MKKFNRSIFLIVLFNVGSYIIATMVITITYRFTEITPVILWYITESTMIYINIGAVGIVPIICLN
uniref:7TM_GPCR_Srx domain-containing protein n=1 Tax=Meloidogyne hapla TaxID=6305 RepID=A0A1I8BK26_MELHA